MSTDIYHCAHEYCNQVPLCLCVLSLSLSLRPTPLHWFRELGLIERSDRVTALMHTRRKQVKRLSNPPSILVRRDEWERAVAMENERIMNESGES